MRRGFGFHAWLQSSEYPYSCLRSFTVRINKPGARAMPPLTGEASRFAPRATGFCIDERISHPTRSRLLKSGLPCQGSGLAASLTPRSGLCEDRSSQPSLKLPGCLMSPRLFSGGERSEAPWACLCQLQTRSVASNSYQECEHAPQIPVKSQAPMRNKGSAGPHPAASYTSVLLHHQPYNCSREKSSRVITSHFGVGTVSSSPIITAKFLWTLRYKRLYRPQTNRDTVDLSNHVFV